MTKVLYVEDDELLRMVTTIALEGAGYAVVEAHHGAQALEVLEYEGGFDFVVSDISMPGGVSGMDVAVAAERARPGCRVVLVSGYASAQIPMLPDTVSYLGKPFRVQQLLDLLAGDRNEGTGVPGLG